MHTQTSVYYCYECNAPLIFTPPTSNQSDSNQSELTTPKSIFCNKCKQNARYLSSDLRPVFPQERLLFEILIDKPFVFAKNAVYASNNVYFVDGKKYVLPKGTFSQIDVIDIVSKYKELENKNSSLTDESFKKHVETFCHLNKQHLDEIVFSEELTRFSDQNGSESTEPKGAIPFIKKHAQDYKQENIVISFSGGKDSTVVQDLVVRALETPELLHVFGDTTLEFPLTYQYVERFKKNNPLVFFKTSRNNEADFIEVAKDIGPPSRVMRWCCSMFKTGPITRILNRLYPNEKLITFYGIRACESVARSKYNRVEDREDEVKISKQVVAAPIFEWKDIDVWLYILSENVDFNDAYLYGWTRVGCWMCPNNNDRSAFLSRIHMQEQSTTWRNFLIDFAKRIGKPDPEVYVDEGSWKARQGGNGVKAANDVKVKMSNCTTEPDAKVYSLKRPASEELFNLFNPFGILRQNGSEVFVHDLRTNVPILSLSQFGIEQDNSLKVRIMNVDTKSREKLEKQISFQILKYNACRFCLKCESLCKFGAINLQGGVYKIDEKKCKRCKMCVESKYLQGGCLMTKYLRTKG